MTRLLAAALTLTLGTSGSACGQRPDRPRPSILKVGGDSVQVKLVDALDARPLANAEVQLSSDNGIRCVRAPCPTASRSWQGRTDAGGRVTIPTNVLQASSSVTAAGEEGDPIEDSEPESSGVWLTPLFPPDSGLAPHPILLIDDTGGRPVANAQVDIDYRAGPRSGRMASRTNALGYLLVPFEVVARASDSTWVIVPGYRRTQLDFAWARRRTVLRRR